ncbi:MAG: iron-containing alcohol dehydrogenase [Dehalococcoidia bacterium]|nr:iron-containing alcohol dehydrogenase [Dehalococcoidia bacterium]
MIKVRSSLREYEVHLGTVHDFLRHLASLEHKLFVVDQNVWRCHADGILSALPRSETITFPALEERKTLEGVQEIYEHLLERSAKRNLTLITVGGGILQDVTGFAASTLYRGINWVFIPTTLLAQADSCIGSKTSLNYGRYKNLIGSFYPPSTIWIDPSFLRTLHKLDFYSGLGEVVKLHIMAGEEKTRQYLGSYDSICALDMSTLQRTIRTSLEIKIDYISDDEFDLGRRNMLNYGHCIGHALESVSDFRIPHGQAVVAGMVLANDIAQRRGILSEEKRRFIETRLLLPSLKVKAKPSDLDAMDIIDAISKDKKRIGSGLVLVMLTEAGEMVRANDVEAQEVRAALEEVANLLCEGSRF